MNKFNIEKYHIIDNTNIDISSVPMLLRRKLSRIDKIAFSILNEIYDDEIDSILFISESGEFDRLQEIITQYQTENMTSPTKFSASVHNYSVSAFSQLNKITKPYNALSAGKDSYFMGILNAILIPNTRTCVCYVDDIGIGTVISTKNDGYTFEQIKGEAQKREDFISFVSGEKDSFTTELGVFKKE